MGGGQRVNPKAVGRMVGWTYGTAISCPTLTIFPLNPKPWCYPTWRGRSEKQTRYFSRNTSKITPQWTIIKLVCFVKAAQIKAAFELGRRQDMEADPGQVSITSPEALAKAIRKSIVEKTKEHFKLVLLNTRNKVIAISTISIGTLNASLVHPREVFKDALAHSASSIILAHNHPSDDPEPSDDDVSLTRRLADAGRLMGIEVLDHIIITRKGYTSFKERGLL